MKLKRSEARAIEETLTDEQMKTMLERAKQFIVDWGVSSRVNPSLSRGFIWNLLVPRAFEKNVKIIRHGLLLEFGDFLPQELWPVRRTRSKAVLKTHQEPTAEIPSNSKER